MKKVDSNVKRSLSFGSDRSVAQIHFGRSVLHDLFIPIIPSLMLASSDFHAKMRIFQLCHHLYHMEHFTKDDLAHEIRGFMWALADSLERVYFPGVGWALLGLDKNRFPTKNKFGHEFGIFDLEPKDVDPMNFRVTDVLLEMYDYGMEGLRREVTSPWCDFATDTGEFIQGLHHFTLLDEGGIDYDLRLSTHVLELATARWKLDDEEGTTALDVSVPGPINGGVLSLSDVALLANMDEKSVRNAANRNNKNRLETFNRGHRTYVTAAAARAWLSDRRGFKPTQHVESSAERDLAKVGFFSAKDFGSYLGKQRERKAQTVSQLTKSIGLSEWTKERLARLEDGNFTLDRVMFAKLAELLGVDKKSFLLASLALHHKLEREDLEEYLEADVQE